MRKIVFLLVAVFFLPDIPGRELSAACGINWSLPENHFTNVNPQGKLSWWGEVGRMDMGDGLELPLHLNFRADRHMHSPTLDVSGFLFGLTDANAVALDERTFLMHTPAGRYLRFRRDKKNPNILDGGKKWKGEIKGDIITITTACGDRLTYRRGQISQMALKERVFDYIYNGRKVSEIREGGTVVVRFKEEAGGLLVQSKDGQQVRFVFGERPMVQSIAGRNVIGKLEKSLATVETASGEVVAFKFGVTPDVKPTLEVGESLLTWNAANGEMLRDGEWKYEIKPGEKPFENAAIGRENAKKQKEFWHHDKVRGKEIVQGIDGVKNITTWFVSGKLNGKMRRKEAVLGNNKKVIYQAFYNENGKLLREALKTGEVNQFEYNDDGGLKTQTRLAKDGSVKSIVEYTNARMRTVHSANGRWTQYFYDEQGREVRMLINGNLHSEKSYADDDSWEKTVVFDQETGKAERTFFYEMDEHGRRIAERVTEHSGDYPEIIKKYFYDKLGQLEKQIDSQQGTILYFDAENGQRTAKISQ